MSDHPDGFAEFTEELRLLAEVLLARVEPVLRRTAADGQADLGGCAWCPVCAAAALVRGEHHDVVAALAEHGTSLVTVLREALAGVPVDPLLPPEWADHAMGHPNPDAPHPTSAQHPPRTATAHDTNAATASTAPRGSSATTAHGTSATTASAASHPAEATAPSAPRTTDNSKVAASADTDTPEPGRNGRSRIRWGSARQDSPRPRRVDEYPATRGQGTPRAPQVPPIEPETGPTPAAENASGTAGFTSAAREDDRRRPATPPRAQYVDIPVTIRG